MNDLEARQLATRVVKDSECVVRFGKTNGLNCLHVRLPGAGSNTIFAAHEWDEHQWNRSNKPREKKPDQDILDAVANREAA